MENYILVLIPIYILYIILIGLRMFIKRYKAVKNKEVSLGYFKDYQQKAPYELQILKNHFDNQFQFPLIFLSLCLAFVISKNVSLITVILGYTFLLSRLAHTYFHIIKNDLRFRAPSYFIGVIMVFMLAVDFSIKNLNA